VSACSSSRALRTRLHAGFLHRYSFHFFGSLLFVSCCRHPLLS
jgi:hypothetical protein